jgi:GAF domain-containing protein
MRNEAEYYRRLYDVTAALSAAALPEDVIAAMFAQGLGVLGADAGFVGLLDDDGEQLIVQRFTDDSGAPVERFHVPLDATYPIVASARDGLPRLIESNDQLECDFPGVQRINPDDHACASIPLLHDGVPVGAINIAFDTPRAFTADERELMALLGTHCAVALERARRLHDAEQRLLALQAMEIHDNVVQDLAVARLALEAGLEAQAMESLTKGLDAAKRIVSDIAVDAPHLRREALH